MCADAVGSGPVFEFVDALLHVPAQFLCLELYATAVRVNGSRLWHVPEPLRTPELCALAVANHAHALGAVPDALRTPALCAAALASYTEPERKYQRREEARGSDRRDPLEFVPNRERTPAAFKVYVEKMNFFGDNTTESYTFMVPETLRTSAMFFAMVKLNGLLLQHVPLDLRTRLLCDAAVAQYFEAIAFVPANDVAGFDGPEDF
jgi:hypothetical protein